MLSILTSYSATPVLVLPSAAGAGRGEVVVDSARIVARLVELFPEQLGWLYPEPHAAEIRALEHELEEKLGANIRQVSW